MNKADLKSIAENLIDTFNEAGKDPSGFIMRIKNRN